MTPRPPLINAQHVTVTFPGRATGLFSRKERTTAVDDVSLEVRPGASLAIVGESGSGKTTLVRALLGLIPLDSGTVSFDGRQVRAKGRERWLRSRTGIVFQDPFSSLNPRLNIDSIVREPLEALGVADPDGSTVQAMLRRLDLPENSGSRYPRSFSGGQRQRIAIARALIHRPDLLIGDEPVSALDVLVRARILDLLKELRSEMGLALITVTHDLSIVPDLAEEILVMRNGRVVEQGTVADVFSHPREEYTKTLISAIPRLPSTKAET